jgi:hypothetical protein
MSEATAIAEELVLSRHPHAVFREYEGETVVLVPSAETEAQVLNEVGGRVWALLDGRRDVASIVETVREEFEVSEEVAASDVRAFLAELLDRDLVRVRT